MIFTSNLLGNLARSIGLALPGRYETDLAIPPSIQPTLVIPQTLISGAVNPALTSFSASSSNDIANAAAQSQVITNVDKGFWEMCIQVHYSSNYVGVTSTIGITITLIDVLTGTKTIVLAQFLPTGTATLINSISLDITRRIVLDQQYQLAFTLSTNGAGQRHTATVNAIFNKLL